MTVKNKVTEWKCGYCGKLFGNPEDYKAHIDNEHWEFNDKPDWVTW